MATISATQVWRAKRASATTWANMLTTDVGTPETPAGLSDRSVQVSGTFGANADVTIQGSNDGVNWVTLSDPQGNALVIDAAVIEQILENTLYVRPNVVAGDGTTSVTVTLFCASTA